MAMISRLPGIKLFASDSNPRAVHCPRENITSFGGQVFEGDLFNALPEELKGRIDVMVANAPHVPMDRIDLMPREAREYEPRETLDGGADGLDVHRRIAKGSGEWLAHEEHVLVETSAAQAELMASIFALNSMETKIVSSHDYDATLVMGRRL